MSATLKRDKKSILKKRSVSHLVSHLSVKIDTSKDNKFCVDKIYTSQTRNESYFDSVWPGLTIFCSLYENNILL